MVLLLYKVGRTASIAGSGTDGQDVIGLWVSGRSIAVPCEYPDLISGRNTDLPLAVVDRVRTGLSIVLVVDRASPSLSMRVQWMERGGACRNHLDWIAD